MSKEIADRMDREKGIVARLDGIEPHFEVARDSLRGVRLDSDAGFRSVFQWPVGSSRAVLNASGETISAPHDFITTLILERVHIKEKPLEDVEALLLSESPSPGGVRVQLP